VGLGQKQGINIDMLDMESITSLLKRLACRKVVLTGGEPLLHEDLLEMVKCLNKIGANVSISTNGTLLTMEKIALLSEAGLKGLSFSYISREYQENLQRNGQWNIESYCQIAKKFGIESNVIVTLTRENFKNVYVTFNYLRKTAKPDNIVFTPVSIESVNKKCFRLDHLSLLEKQKLIDSLELWATEYNYEGYLNLISANLLAPQLNYRNFCTKQNSIVIFPDGNIRPCFSIKTPIIGHVSSPRIFELVEEFNNTFFYDCFSYNCLCQAQFKDR
jgi:MoaA/NifB/PqqE/SkfB family radical SAM enzyme